MIACPVMSVEPPRARDAFVAAALRRAHEDLAEGRYEQARETLEWSARRRPGRDIAPLWLHLAACHALDGDAGLEAGSAALRAATDLDRDLSTDPLARVLAIAFGALRGTPASVVKRALRAIPAPLPSEAAFHAAATMLYVGDAKGALRRLQPLVDVPDHLRWRRWSLIGQAHEEGGDLSAAAAAYEAAIEAAPAVDRATERLALASCLLDLDRPKEVLAIADAIDVDALEPYDAAELRTLTGRAHLDLDNPNQALALLAAARALDPEPNFTTIFALAQAQAALRRYDAAQETLAEALALAPAQHRSYVLHELAWVLQERDEPDRAAEVLADVVADESYPSRAIALSELADVHLRTGDVDRARMTAEQALEAGAVAPACLVLGALALEYYHLDEAVRHYEQALAASTPGDPNWLAAHQFLADVHAQRGPSAADRALRHALVALEHTDATSEWRLPLEAHVAWARNVLSGHDRLLN